MQVALLPSVALRLNSLVLQERVDAAQWIRKILSVGTPSFQVSRRCWPDARARLCLCEGVCVCVLVYLALHAAHACALYILVVLSCVAPRRPCAQWTTRPFKRLWTAVLYPSWWGACTSQPTLICRQEHHAWMGWRGVVAGSIVPQQTSCSCSVKRVNNPHPAVTVNNRGGPALLPV